MDCYDSDTKWSLVFVEMTVDAGQTVTLDITEDDYKQVRTAIKDQEAERIQGDIERQHKFAEEIVDMVSGDL
jgi:hypothetical protein